jgi:nicotinic acetylcholine receptor, invertebrate
MIKVQCVDSVSSRQIFVSFASSADGKYEVSYKPNVVIHSEGDVLWIPPAIYKSSCTIDVKYFPFDEQSCEMKFGSWTFNGDQVLCY